MSILNMALVPVIFTVAHVVTLHPYHLQLPGPTKLSDSETSRTRIAVQELDLSYVLPQGYVPNHRASYTELNILSSHPGTPEQGACEMGRMASLLAPRSSTWGSEAYEQ